MAVAVPGNAPGPAHLLPRGLLRATSTAGLVRLELDLSPIHVPIDQAVPCGLIVNELLTNSLKHAFTAGEGGDVRVSLQPEAQGVVRLQVIDSGAGPPGDSESKRGKSLGLQLVSDLARRLGGRLEVGAGFAVIFTAIAPPATGQSLRPLEGELKS